MANAGVTLLLRKNPVDERRPRVKGGSGARKTLPSRRRHDTFLIGTLRGSAFDSIRHTTPNRITLEIFPRLKLFGSSASMSSSRSPITGYEKAGIHLHSFILRRNPHCSPINTGVSRVMK